MLAVFAAKGQRYGNLIGHKQESTTEVSTAILLASVLAKTIELIFVTAFVAFLGQLLSRKALVSSSRGGVTLAELTMWRWIVQPGTLLTQYEISKYSGFSFLGLLILVSAVLSTLYVTAATVLVQPLAKQSDWHSSTLAALTQSDFANLSYLQEWCQSLITRLTDQDSGKDRLQFDFAGKSFYDLGTLFSDQTK